MGDPPQHQAEQQQQPHHPPFQPLTQTSPKKNKTSASPWHYNKPKMHKPTKPPKNDMNKQQRHNHTVPSVPTPVHPYPPSVRHKRLRRNVWLLRRLLLIIMLRVV